MKFPILAYGHPVLRQKCAEISPDYPGLKKLIKDMWTTMYAANGAGLAAPQIGRPIRLFILDTVQMYKDADSKERELYVGDEGIKEVFINPVITETDGRLWTDVEGCLSIPRLQLDIERKMMLTINYVNEKFEPNKMTVIGVSARAVFHEYDHIEGILMTDYRDKEELREQLQRISSGNVKVPYKMKFFKEV
jgi:peptide deformylase